MRIAFRRRPTLGIVIAAAIAPPLTAHANLLIDGSFETPQLGYGNFVYESGTLNGWTYSPHVAGQSAALLVDVETSTPWVNGQSGADGSQVAAIQYEGYISQTFTALSSGIYDVSWLDAGRANFGGLDGNQTYIASLYNNTLSAITASYSYTTVTQSNFKGESFLAALVAGDSYTITFMGQTLANQAALIDNVQVSEPGTIALLGAAVATLIRLRRRRPA